MGLTIIKPLKQGCMAPVLAVILQLIFSERQILVGMTPQEKLPHTHSGNSLVGLPEDGARRRE